MSKSKEQPRVQKPASVRRQLPGEVGGIRVSPSIIAAGFFTTEPSSKCLQAPVAAESGGEPKLSTEMKHQHLLSGNVIKSNLIPELSPVVLPTPNPAVAPTGWSLASPNTPLASLGGDHLGDHGSDDALLLAHRMGL